MAGQLGTDRLMSEINVVPFVDVMLVLLIIFMVAAPMMIQGVDVSLPATTSEPLSSETENLVVSITKDHQIFINDFEVTLDTLREKLHSIFQGRAARELYLRADRDIPYGLVVQVMAESKNAGVETMGIITVPLERD